MSCIGNFGISAIVDREIIINQQLHAFIGNDSIDSKYLAYCIQNNKNYLEKKSTSTTIKYLNKENCNSMPFPLCTLAEQEAIVSEIEERLSVCDALEASIEKGLAQAESLRQSILKKAFEGKLVPQDSDDEPAGLLLERIKREREAVVANKATTQKNTRKRGEA
jgi:type I restriction enzyme S subunit